MPPHVVGTVVALFTAGVLFVPLNTHRAYQAASLVLSWPAFVTLLVVVELLPLGHVASS